MLQKFTLKKTPIAIFVYNRAAHTSKVLASLSRCDRLDECEVFIYCDGAKSEDQLVAVDATRRVVRGWALSVGAHIIERVRNLGLARSIVTGVSELCARYGRVIVVEDDLVLSSDFVDYMLQALDRYQNAHDVYQVSAYMFSVNHPEKPDAFFLPFTTTWGWATWDRAWKIFNWDAADAKLALADSETRKRFDLDGSYPYSKMLEQRLAGKNNSWGILFWWAVFKAGGLVLHPRRSLVWQGGFDGSGVHCGQDTKFDQDTLDVFGQSRLSKPLIWPEAVAANQEAFDKIKNFLVRSGCGQESPMKSILRKAAARLRGH